MTIDLPGGRSATQSPPVKGRLLHRVRQAIRTRHYSPRTEQAYVHWIRRYIFFHKVRHPAEMGTAEINAFLELEIGLLEGVVRAKRPARLPVVLTRDEARRLFAHLQGTVLLVCHLLYGSGLRLLECLQLRVKDLERAEITVRDGKGQRIA